MILGIDKLHELVKEKKLVENLCERELNNPEGAGFDLRIGEIYQNTSGGFMGIDEREIPEPKLIEKFEENKKKTVILEPGEYYVIKTIETVNTPKDIMILFRPRITFFRCGVTVFTGNCAPGYRGPLFFGLANLGKFPFKLEMGARVVHAMFHQIDGSSNLYQGQWQGGRLSTEGKEKQV